jgi:NMD protein affecting ribosome stability and mRNA decay
MTLSAFVPPVTTKDTKEEMKYCRKCDTVKPRSEFYIRETVSDGLYTYCKKCKSKDNSKYSSSPRRKEWFSKWYVANRSTIKKNLKKNAIKRKYGLDIDEYNQLLESQNHKCAICGEEMHGREVTVDHCHQTMRIRGILCGKCNKGLGHFRDRIDVLTKAISYLEHYRVLHEITPGKKIPGGM